MSLHFCNLSAWSAPPLFDLAPVSILNPAFPSAANAVGSDLNTATNVVGSGLDTAENATNSALHTAITYSGDGRAEMAADLIA